MNITVVHDGYLPRAAAPTPAARRRRRHRARRKQDHFVVPVEGTCEMISALVDQGDVDETNSSDLDCVGKAITAAARRGLRFDLGQMSEVGGRAEVDFGQLEVCL